MKTYSIQDLADIRRNFDINEHAEDAERIVANQAGETYGDITPAEDVEQQSSLTVNAAASDLEFTKSQGFHGVIQVIDDRIEFFTAKSKNIKLPADERGAYRDMALGVEQTKLAIAEWVAERRLRLQNASTKERQTMGANAKAKIESLVADSVAAPKPSEIDNRDDFLMSASGWGENSEPEVKPVRIDGVNFISRKT